MADQSVYVPGITMSFTARARTLIVNQKPNLSDNIMRLLNEEGITQVDIADSGQAAIQALKKQAYDVVISDIEIDGMDAWRLTRLIRSGILHTPA
ncbi:response regulator, partial [bacterium]|nr:response regulator [bacterium]